jgi:beta-1,4-mannosyltransferase
MAFLNSLLDISLAIAVVCSTIFTLFLITLPSRFHLRDGKHEKESEGSSTDLGKPSLTKAYKTSVQILVLGDIGRSPRMQYHAISIAKLGGSVQLIGYTESKVHPDLISNSSVSIIAIPPPPKTLQTSNKALFLLFGPLKVLWQIGSLWYILGYRCSPSRWLLVQNPPSIPTLAIAHFMAVIRNTHLIIDWHNFGHSILALKLGHTHPLVKLSKMYETFFGGFASANFAVTDAMARLLKKEYGVGAPILTLHDRPPADFRPLDNMERFEFLVTNNTTKPYAGKLLDQPPKARLLVSSTSWTPDEDFSILLDALVEYSTAWKKGKVPDLVAIITGKGPQQAYYLREISKLKATDKLEGVDIHTAWLSATDYPLLLASADLGVSLHTSSSGVDLPMKVVDMFGAGLPVVGWSAFEAWPELVTEGVNGKGFGSPKELAALLESLFRLGNGDLEKLRQGAIKEGGRRWDDEWGPVAGRVLGVVD